MRESMMLECCASIYILILLVSTAHRQGAKLQRSGGFQFSLIVALLATLFDMAALQASALPALPRSTRIAVNLLHFLLTLLMTSTITCDAAALLFEERTQIRSHKHVCWLLRAMYALAAGAAIVNACTGAFYAIDPAAHYADGPAAWAVYWFMVFNMGVLLLAFLLERKRARHAFYRVAVLLPLLALAAMALQAYYPGLRISGMLASMMLTVLFINGQQQRLYTDHLTALGSREAFYRTLEDFAGHRTLFHVIIVSLRDYKSVNARFGQRTGDAFLRQIAAWLGTLERSAVTCRFSGVEFALVVPDARVRDYEALIATIAERFAAPWTYGIHTLTLRASLADIGWPAHAATVNELISSLEYAVRLSKRKSGGVVRFDKQLRNQAGRRDYILSQLECALHENRYFLHYQPIIDCASGRFVGAEALCRMQDVAGVILPGEFVPLAEETELIQQIDRQVLTAACRFLDAHRDCGLEWISVNISGMEYQSAELREWLYALLERHHLPRGSIRLEITERILVPDMDSVYEAVEQLRAHGVGLCLDDFGVGYSNLFSVIRLSLDCVKIDRSLVEHICEDERARDMLHTLVEGLRVLGVNILAEGVETVEQQRLIEEMGVDYVQGYYHARPMSGDSLVALFAGQVRKKGENAT